MQSAEIATEAIGEEQQLADEIDVATEPLTEAGVVQEGSGVRASSIMASPVIEEIQTDEVVVEVDVAIGDAGEEKPIVTSVVAKEPAVSGANITMVEPHKERPLKVAEQEVSVEMTPPIDVPTLQVDEGGHSGTVSSLITESITESMQIPLNKLLDIASASGTTLSF